MDGRSISKEESAEWAWSAITAQAIRQKKGVDQIRGEGTRAKERHRITLGHGYTRTRMRANVANRSREKEDSKDVLALQGPLEQNTPRAFVTNNRSTDIL